jgi:hypothetical protein
LLVLAAAVGMFAAQSSGSSSASHRIDQRAVGSAPLGLRRAAYVRRLGRVSYTTRLPGGLRRLTFGRREIDVYLSRTGRGVAILTSEEEYRTKAGVGPCSSLRSLKRAYRRRLAVKRQARSIVAYRLGRLVFAVPAHRVGVVMLASPQFPVTIAVNAGQCGVGEGE